MSKPHSIIKAPHNYRLIYFFYNCKSKNYLDHFIDIHLKNNNIIRRLRFIAPINLKIEKGFPLSTGGMEILDVSKNQLENINIEVRDFEANQGSITFDAKEIIDLDILEI